jgi:hypothetical protein
MLIGDKPSTLPADMTLPPVLTWTNRVQFHDRQQSSPTGFLQVFFSLRCYHALLAALRRGGLATPVFHPAPIDTNMPDMCRSDDRQDVRLNSSFSDGDKFCGGVNE